jgi:hypothetical protein
MEAQLLKTNSKVYQDRIFKYLLGIIDDEESIGMTDSKKIKFLFERWDEEHNNAYNKKKFPNEQARLADWISGLPSSINLPAYNHEVLDLAKELHDVKFLSDRQENIITENFYSHVASQLLKLREKFAKPTGKNDLEGFLNSVGITL